MDSVNLNVVRVPFWRATSCKKLMPDAFTANCIGGLVFSGLGFVAFTYGKRMRHWTPMICGLILMLLPLFVADLALLLMSALLGATAIIFRHS
jgi:hypothetical protein